MNTEFIQRQAAKLPPYWKLATIRCCIYALIVGWGSFETGIDGYESFHDMTQMQFWKFIGNIAISMLGVWLAFLDQSLSRYSNNLAASQNQTVTPVGGQSSTNQPT